ncbi:hypothetical protein JCM10914A_56080 [Paenibacillus sp. JCM 10914]|uniref:hypothetical protein n=1 Tax=Paenibacillus sp. JCM 10914 TaxID=1236974 RepID=UPI0003CC71CB|nr:hypothetical protein [Paenibacillus sp. JCM 10914]GAE09594.1 hypothetical protein JCM10914_5962 [Paenibacillus sp. JCM 10914]
MIGKANEIFVKQIKTIENDLDLRISNFLIKNPTFQIIQMDFTTVMMVRGSYQQQTQYARDSVFITYKQA